MNEVVQLSKNVSVMIQKKLPVKCKDQGSFTVPIIIGKSRFENAMLDLGASINVMPLSIYKTLALGELKKDGCVIQLADRSKTYPLGLVEDVLVQVGKFVYPTDFYVLDIPESDDPLPIFLGRPFMCTSKTKIDVHAGVFNMEFDGEVIIFKLSETMRYPLDDNSCFSIESLDPSAPYFFETMNDDFMEPILARSMDENHPALQHLDAEHPVVEQVAALTESMKPDHLDNLNRSLENRKKYSDEEQVILDTLKKVEKKFLAECKNLKNFTIPSTKNRGNFDSNFALPLPNCKSSLVFRPPTGCSTMQGLYAMKEEPPPWSVCEAFG